MRKENQHLSFEEVLSRLIRYCNYQDRSEREVYLKAGKLMSDTKTITRLMDFLKEENYIDDLRFAKAYVKGKMQQKKWGRLKIRQGLVQKGVASSLINTAIDKIDQQQYTENLRALIEKRNGKGKMEQEEKSRLYRYLLSKGYESNLILELLN